MKKLIFLNLSILTLVFTVNASTNCNLKSIFQTPRKRNYDEFQILERSNFQSDEDMDTPQRIKLEQPLPSSLSNAKILLKLGDYNNDIRRNNNNVNTKITLAGPNHNNYYHPSLIYPYSGIPLQNLHPWNFAFSVPRTPQYYIFSGPNYVPRYQILPQNFPIISGQYPNGNRILYNDGAIQNIPLHPLRKNSSPSNGLNTMTVIPKILIDTVVTKPEVLEIIESNKPARLTACKNSLSKRLEKEINIALEDNRKPNVYGKPVDIDNEIPVQRTCSGNIRKPCCKSENLRRIEKVVEDNIRGNAENIWDKTLTYSVGDSVDLLPEKNLEILKVDAGPQFENIMLNLKSKPNEIHNINHPRVLHPVKLTGIENVEILGAGNLNLSLTNNLPQVIEKCSNSKDFELVKLLQKSLVPFINLKTKEEPKLLVSYPVIHNPNRGTPSAIVVQATTTEPTICQECNSCRRRPKADIDDLNVMRGTILPANDLLFPNIIKSSENSRVSSMNIQSIDGVASISGGQITSGSGYYQDQTRKILYTKPTEILSIPPQLSQNLITPPQVSLLGPSNFLPKYANLNDAIPQNIPSLSTLSSSSFLDFLRLISPSARVLPIEISAPNPQPFSSNIISAPRIVKCPYCSRDHDLSSLNVSPVVQQISPQQTTFWNPKPLSSRCPHCAKYVGELNQLG